MKKQCRRKVWALVNPITHAIEGAAIITDDVIQGLRTRELSAIEAFHKNRAGLQEWCDLVALMNVAEHMAFNGVGPEAKPTLHEAHGHLIAAANRYESTKKMGLTGPGLNCMREMYEWHDLQRKSISRTEYNKHIKSTVNRIKSKAPEVTDVMDVAAGLRLFAGAKA